MPTPRRDESEACFMQSLQLGRDQGARAWELRTSIGLAGLWASDGRRDAARTLLQPVFEWFTEGFETADLAAAKHLLATLA
jgi:predicted ATPase